MYDDTDDAPPPSTDDLTRPCERCDAPSLGGRWCPDCEAYLESLDLPGAH